IESLNNKYLLSVLFSECKGEDRVIQPTEDVFASEGDTVTLDCTFETTRTSPTLFWYRQKCNDFPRYMLKSYSDNAEKASEFQTDRFNAAINGTSVPLKIQKLQLTDSAVYYCAVKPTVTGNTTTLYKNLWREDNTILHNIH
uniref:Ig-like domain-containing protein n=1 Tax=Labrus bergylta TaxID=56723 RepID=A0A3Q3EIG4_9LABR